MVSKFNPDGNCFFIAVDAAVNNKTNVHSRHSQGAKNLRRIIVNSMDKLLCTTILVERLKCTIHY